METQSSFVIFFFVACATGFSQGVATPAITSNYTVPDRAQFYKVLAALGPVTNGVTMKDARGDGYTVVANGLNWRNPLGQWVESTPIAQAFSGGIICTGASYRVILSANVNTANAVDLETSDHQRIISRPLGLAYFDPDSGRTEWLARVKDSQAQIVASNQIIYADAFDGNGIDAAITYTYEVGRFHQDVTLLKRPQLTPAAFAMGSRARLEILSEIVQSPVPTRTARVLRSETNPALRAAMAEPDLVDETIGFGEMVMGIGRAFRSGEGPRASSFFVAKRLVNISGRTVLTEAVQWTEVSAELEKLPQLVSSSAGASPNAQQASNQPGANRDMSAIARHSSLEQMPPKLSLPSSESFESRLAEIVRSARLMASTYSGSTVRALSKGFVIDYELVQSIGSFTFQTGHTYLIQNAVMIGDATFEAGTVIKYAPGASLTVTGTAVCPQSGKAILTAVDDDSAGAPIFASTGHPTGSYAAIAVQAAQNPYYWQNLDIRYAQTGFCAFYGYPSILSSWFFECSAGVQAYYSQATLSSVDMCSVDTPTSGNTVSGDFTTCEADRNGNSLPDSWEQDHFGNLNEIASGDPDGDGLSNLQEYQGGTDPLHADNAAYPGCVWPGSSIAGWWRAEGNAYDSISGITGTLYNGATTTAGKVGQAFSLDGINDHVRIADRAGLRFTSAMTVEAWVYPIANSYYPNIATKWDIYGGINQRSYTLAQTPDGHVYFGISSNGRDDGAASATSLTALPLNQWTHVAGTYDGTAVKIYVNGVLEAQTAHTGGIYAGTDDLCIGGACGGAPPGTAAYMFKGRVDEVALYNTALSDTLIAGIYAAQSSGKCLDSDSDGMPDDWEMKHFGDLTQVGTQAQGGNFDYDGDGVDNYTEYQHGTDPNTITFSISAENNYVDSSEVTVQVNITGGHAASQAVLVDSARFQNATWTTYTPSSISVNLGTIDGWHDVRIGLRGRDSTSQQTWQWKRFKLDRSPPTIAITNPASSTVTQPMIELQGYSPEALSSISCDVNNEQGTFSDQMILVLDQFFDTNTFEFTTNWIQGFDLELAEGLNTITIHATDLAGNVTTTNFAFTLARDSVAPVVQLWWPQDCAQLCGDTFTWRGLVDDFTSTLTAEVVNGGITNVGTAIVERDGKFWFQDLPLASGSSQLKLTAVDVWNNVTETNIQVTKSAVELTIDPVYEYYLNNSTITVSGTINVGDHSVWVNGKKASAPIYNGSTWTWSANGVPMTPGGTAVIQARAILKTTEDPGGDGTGGSGGAHAVMSNPGNPTSPQQKDKGAEPDKSWQLFKNEDHIYMQTEQWTDYYREYQNGYMQKWSLNEGTNIYYHHWTNEVNNGGTGSGASDGSYRKIFSDAPTQDDPLCMTTFTWPEGESGLARYEPCNGESFLDSSPDIDSERCLVIDPAPSDYDVWNYNPNNGITGRNTGHIDYTRSAQTKWRLFTGGKATPKRQNLWVLSGSAAEVLDKWEQRPFMGSTRTIPNQAIIIDGSPLSGDGFLYKVYPDGLTKDVTPEVMYGVDFYIFSVWASKHVLKIQVNDGVTLEPDKAVDNANFCVGQKLHFSTVWSPQAPLGLQEEVVYSWDFDGDFVNDHFQEFPHGSDGWFFNPDLLTSDTPDNWWVSGGFVPIDYAGHVQKGVRFVNGQAASVTADGVFKMHRPKLYNYVPDARGNPGAKITPASPFDLLDTDPPAQFCVFVNSEFDGQMGTTQLVNGYATVMGGVHVPNQDTYGEWYLDNQEFYPYDTNGSTFIPVIANAPPQLTRPFCNFAILSDHPSVGCIGRTERHDDFEDYVRFQPAGTGSIFITLGLVHWHIYATADRMGGAYQVVGDPNGYIDPINHNIESDQFPSWLDTLHNQ